MTIGGVDMRYVEGGQTPTVENLDVKDNGQPKNPATERLCIALACARYGFDCL